MPITSTYTCDICGASETFGRAPLMGYELGQWKWVEGLYICGQHRVEESFVVDDVERKRREVKRW